MGGFSGNFCGRDKALMEGYRYRVVIGDPHLSPSLPTWENHANKPYNLNMNNTVIFSMSKIAMQRSLSF